LGWVSRRKNIITMTDIAFRAVIADQQKQIDELKELVNTLCVATIDHRWNATRKNQEEHRRLLGSYLEPSNPAYNYVTHAASALKEKAKITIGDHVSPIVLEHQRKVCKQRLDELYAKEHGCTPDEMIIKQAEAKAKAEAEQEKKDLAARIAKVAALEEETKQAEAEAVAITLDDLDRKERELRARLAEARAAKKAPKKKAAASSDPATWSKEKAEKVSAMWCE
jgi:hypothetical protein